MHRPSTLWLFWLFARTAARRFTNRFLFGWQKKAEARRRKRGLPEPERTATAHRHQRFRAGNLLAFLFAAFMFFGIGSAMEISFRRAMNSVIQGVQAVPPKTPEDRKLEAMGSQGLDPNARQQGDIMLEDPLQRMTRATRRTGDKVTGLMMLISGLGVLLFSAGMLSRNVTRPEPSLAWLFEFPVPRPVLFASKLSECLFDGASLPLLSMLPGIFLYHSGFTFFSSVGWGLAFGVMIALVVAALRIAIEVLLLQKCQRRRRGTITGVCAAAGGLLMVIVLYGGGTPSLIRFLLAAADWLPDWFFWNPFSAGFGVPSAIVPQWLASAGIAAALCAGSVLFCSRLTRFGLEPGLETARGEKPAAIPQTHRLFPTGLVGKELLMLARQRTVLVQVLLAPVIMVLMMYFQSNGRLADRALGSDGALASAIFGLSAYMVLIASQVAMNTELRTLWLLLSLPRPLADSLRVKSRIWGVAAALLSLVLAVIAMIARQDFAGGLLYRLPFMVVLVALIADLSVGIRTMGSSILSETTVHFRQWAAWLPLLLSAAAGQAVFSGDVWMLCVQVVLLGALDVSVWQKLNAELPWITEPMEDPPPRLYLMHGLLAAYGYFVLQGLGMLLAKNLKVTPAAIMPTASAIAAAIVASLTFFLLTRKKVRILPDDPVLPVQCLPVTAAGIVAACGVGFLWVKLLEVMPGASGLLERSRAVLPRPDDTGSWIGLIVMVVMVAPVCEEFIFRGLIYQGLRRTHGVVWSVLWSSLFFAAVHPPVSAPAVFALAAVNALIMERTGRLSTCIAAHAAYNAFVLLL